MVKITDGIKVKYASYRELGKLMINMNLLDDNILLVKYKSYAPLATLRRSKISDEFKDLVLYLFDTNEIDYPSAQKLNIQEKEKLDILITRSGLKLQLKYNKNKLKEKIEDIVTEFNVLKGEILAGNDNPEIKNKIANVLDKLVYAAKISETDAKDIIRDLE
jgi:hypothetical protein